MIYIVLPVFNEGLTIARLITKIRQIPLASNAKIIAVNDGSRDQSLMELKRLAGRDLEIATHKINMNIGAVFSTGISRVLTQAKPNDVLVIMESDGTSGLEILPQMVNPIISNRTDVVIASRYQPGGSYRNFPWTRKVFSYGANFMMRQLFPISGVSDYTIFYRSYRVAILQKAVDTYGLFGLIQSLGFVANAELLIKLSFLTDRISEVPNVYDYGRKKGKSKIAVWRTINEYFTVISYLNRIREKIKQC